MTTSSLPNSSHSISKAEPSLAPIQALSVQDMQQVNEVIIRSVEQPVPLITDITKHIVQSGGKRLRPVLTLACAQFLHYEGEHHRTLAAAVELIHTATLLHDDVVDESTLRRGIETANTVWSNQASVLVGDFLLSRAFQLMVASGSLDVLKLLSDASATISQGEVTQLMAAGNLDTPVETYFEIITAKTATLFSAACEIAPIIMQEEGLRASFRDFGLYLGIAFQLVDDALDYSAKQATLGKTIGDDLREGKITLPVLEAYRNASDKDRLFWQRVFEEGVSDDKECSYAIQRVAQDGGIDATFAMARDYIAKAYTCLERIDGDAKVKHALASCLEFCLARTV